jgi:hypothetical protein
MRETTLRYDLMVEQALRGVVRQAMAQVARDGLPGNHHFYVSFRTTAPGVQIAERLRAQYPEEMTIVLQHQFWGLEVEPDSFSVTLSFNGSNERLLIPFAAITAFVDPAVNFGLPFKAVVRGDAQAPGGAAGSEPAPATPDDTNAQVVSLDTFRRK